MALAETTLSSAVAAGDNVINVASATSFAAGRLVQVDGELMKVGHAYSSGTEIPVMRGWDGTAVKAHVSSARVVHGAPADFAARTAGQGSLYPYSGRAREIVSYSAAATITPPKPGSDLLVVINGTSVVALTIAVPTKDLDGSVITFVANGAAAHTLTFTGGLSDAGTSYDVVTFNGTKPAALTVIACNEMWIAPFAPAMGGTVTNLIGSVA